MKTLSVNFDASSINDANSPPPFVLAGSCALSPLTAAPTAKCNNLIRDVVVEPNLFKNMHTVVCDFPFLGQLTPILAQFL